MYGRLQRWNIQKRSVVSMNFRVASSSFLLMSIFVGLFYFFSSFCVLSAIFVVITKNPIFSILFLILAFVNVSCSLFLFSFEFLPISFLVIYVGAIAILFLFVLMMLNIKLAVLNQTYNNFIPFAVLFFFAFLPFFVFFVARN